MTTLTLDQSNRLVELERTIKRGIASFIEVGNALSEIRDSKLYLIEHETFEDYCRKKWGMERSNAYDLMATSRVALNVQDLGHSVNREAARELAKVPEEKQAEVVKAAAKSGKVTAKAIRATKPKPEPDLEEAPEDRTAELGDALVETTKDNERLSELNKALSATDQGAKIVKLQEQIGSLRGEIKGLMTEKNEAVKQAKYFQGVCDKLRKLLGLEKASEIYATVEKMKG